MSDDTKFTEKDYLNAAANEVDRIASEDGIANVDQDLIDHMGLVEDDALSVEDALESIVILGDEDTDGEVN